MSERRPFSDISEASALRLAQSLRAQAPARRDLAQPPRARAVFLLFLGFLLPMLAAARFIGASQSDLTRRPEMNLKAMAVVAGAVVASTASGDAVQWRVQDGGNGHWYKFLPAEGSTWDTCRSVAILQGAELASVVSSAEKAVVTVAMSFSPSQKAVWLGGHAPQGTSGLSGWTWSDGAPWGYAAWGAGLPNNSGATRRFVVTTRDGVLWDDYRDQDAAAFVQGAVIEWSADCNNDGIVDYGQCRDGSLADINSNNIPDCCEQGAPCLLGATPFEWRIADGGNGHWYGVVATPADISWTAAQSDCESRGGHLATLTSAAEDDFVWPLARQSALWIVVNGPGWSGAKGPWLGLHQAPGSPTNAGWSWVTGEPFSWAHPSFVPNDGCSINEDSLNYIGDVPSSRIWNDFPGDVPCAVWGFPRSYVIEWSSDCNNDGLVDYGQILRGELADTNANGVPDICESTIFVPSQFPTIQAAIDSVPANAQRTIQVAAGNYHESFALNGKNIVVRGAANNATILDGTGLAASIARFTGGEPATAGVEGLVFRNGTTGSRLTPTTTFTVGGAIYAFNTSAHVRDCRFENCRADYGGAIYHYFGTLAWENCVFTGNIANAEGGAALVYNCTGTVLGCSFIGNRCGMFGPGSGSAFKSVGSNGEGESVVLDSCTVTGNIAGGSGSALEHYEHTKFHPGVLRIVNTTVAGNISGQPTPTGAAGLRVLGRMQSCVIASGSSICGNSPQQVAGPYFIEGSVTVCGCAGDITGDGFVNGGDLGVLLANWGVTAPSGLADVTHDGMVDGSDLSIVLSTWGACP